MENNVFYDFQLKNNDFWETMFFSIQKTMFSTRKIFLFKRKDNVS